MEERIQKIIARAGITSRRDAEHLITDGRVTVNGEVVTELGSKADIEKDHIKVDGKLIQQDEQDKIYLLLNKPKGVVSTVNDPEDRPTVVDLIKGFNARIYPVGRLDFNTEGALLLTNDGDLANKLLTPKSKCPKVYMVKVSGVPDPKTIMRLERGITVDGARYSPCQIQILKTDNNTWLKVVLYEGKNHQIRNMFESINHPVSKLRRVAFAFLTTEQLPIGEWRELTTAEVRRLQRGDYEPKVPLQMTPHLRNVGIDVSDGDIAKLDAYAPANRGLAPRRPRLRRPNQGGKPIRGRKSFKGGPGRPSGPGGRDTRRPHPQRDGDDTQRNRDGYRNEGGHRNHQDRRDRPDRQQGERGGRGGDYGNRRQGERDGRGDFNNRQQGEGRGGRSGDYGNRRQGERGGRGDFGNRQQGENRGGRGGDFGNRQQGEGRGGRGGDYGNRQQGERGGRGGFGNRQQGERGGRGGFDNRKQGERGGRGGFDNRKQGEGRGGRDGDFGDRKQEGRGGSGGHRNHQQRSDQGNRNSDDRRGGDNRSSRGGGDRNNNRGGGNRGFSGNNRGGGGGSRRGGNQGGGSRGNRLRSGRGPGKSSFSKGGNSNRGGKS